MSKGFRLAENSALKLAALLDEQLVGEMAELTAELSGAY